MSNIKKPARNVSGAGAITPLYHNELEQILDGMYHAAHTDGLNDVFRPAPKVEQYKKLITANYTPNSKLKALIEASEKLNLEMHGRPDCKNCALQEQLAELTKDQL